MVKVSYEDDSLPQGLVLKPGDELHLYQRRRMAVAIWGAPDRAGAEMREAAIKALAEHGHGVSSARLTTAWVDESAFWSDYEIDLVLVYGGPIDPEAEPLEAGAGWVIVASVLIGLALTGWIVSGLRRTVVEVNEGGLADTISLFPIAAVLLGAFFLLRKKA